MKLSYLISAIQKKKRIIFHTPDDLFQVNSKYESNVVAGYEIIIRITNKCNINCEFCFVNSLKKDYDKTLLNELITSLCSIDLSKIKVVLSGGEPSIHPNFYDFVNNFSEHNAPVIVQTNAILFSDSINVRKLPLNNLSFFISLPSSNQKNYEKITNSNKFSLAIKGIKNLSKFYEVVINFVVYKDNYKDFVYFVDLIKEEFNEKNITLLISNLGMTNKLKISPKLENYTKIVNSIKPLFDKKYDFKIKFTLSGGCSFPLCVLNNIIDLDNNDLFKANEKLISFDKLDNSFYKKKICFKCNFNFYCQGFLKEYILKFGDSEIVPILEKDF